MNMGWSRVWSVPEAGSVRIVEVSPRDGLQNEATPVSLEAKIELVHRLIASGCQSIEATSFVHPKLVPQLADADELMRALGTIPDVDLIALVPNERGYERAGAVGCRHVEVFTAATEAFCQANTRCSIEESFVRFESIFARARVDGVAVRGAVSVAFHCPYSGEVSPEAPTGIAKQLLDLGCSVVAICDTTGRATAEQVKRMLDLVVAELPLDQIAMHFHDTTGLASGHIAASYEAGIRTFDSSAGGLGGCPFAPGAPGNVATEAVLALFNGLEVVHGIDGNALTETGQWIRSQLASASVAS
jgi:hydroxymethylglutaryl-CoA lyase